MTEPRINPEAVKALEAREAIVRKGLRLQIATELLAARIASRGNALASDREISLRHADALIAENEAMP